MNIKKLDKNGPILIEPNIFYDDRGYFFESFNAQEFIEKVCDTTFVQDNESCSTFGVLRGLHFQKPPYDQAKLVRVVRGAVYDVVVDIRKDSPNYKKYYVVYLSEDNHAQFFVPKGFAHGFVSLSDKTIFQYKCDNFYNKESEGAIAWNDEEIGINWDDLINKEKIKLSEKDKLNKPLCKIDNPF